MTSGDNSPGQQGVNGMAGMADEQVRALIERLNQAESDRDMLARQMSALLSIKNGAVPAENMAELGRNALNEIGRMIGRREGAALDAHGARFPQTWPSLTDELAIPPRTDPHRVATLAGWGHNVLIAGSRKVGKTTLLVNLGAAFSLSRLYVPWADWHRLAFTEAPCAMLPEPQWRPGRFLGSFDVKASGNVAYVNLEMDPDDLRDEFRRLPPGGYDPSRIRLLHLRGEELAFIASPAGRERFVRWLRASNVEVLITDTWGALGSKNGVKSFNDDAEARRITDGLDAIKEAAGVSSMFLPIHTPHQNGERHMERFKGAGAVGDWADALWTYVSDDNGVRYLSATGRSRIDFEESALNFDPATGLLSYAGGSRRQEAKQQHHDATEQRVFDYVRKNPGAGAAEIVNCGGNKEANARALRSAVVGRLIWVVPQEHNKKAHYLAGELPPVPQDQAGNLGEAGVPPVPQTPWGT